MPRGVDHVVHAVRDLDAAAELYGRLGFTVGGRNRHPWGTHNRIVQFAGVYIEILAVGEPALIPAHAPRSFSFGAFNRDFLARHEGLSMLALAGQGEADVAAFRASGIGDFAGFEFAREARRADGSPTRPAFSLAFAADPRAPDAGFFTCRHHHPENFWNPAFQAHPNTAASVAAVVIVAENPSDHRGFLSAFVGEQEIQATATGITVPAANGLIQVMDQASFRAQFGVEPPDVAGGGRLAGLRLAVRDMAAAVTVLKKSGIDAAMRMGRIVVDPSSALGATLAFEPEGSARVRAAH